MSNEAKNATEAHERKSPEFQGWEEIFPEGSWGKTCVKYLEHIGFPADFSTLISLFPVSATLGNFAYIENSKGRVNPNLFMMPLGATSSCKDVLINAVTIIIPNVKIESPENSDDKDSDEPKEKELTLYCGSDSTGAGVFDALLKRNGIGYFTFSEYSDFLRKNKRSLHNPESIFKTLYGAKSAYIPAQKQYTDVEPLEYPAPSRLAVSQIDRIMDDIDMDTKLDGSMARNIFMLMPSDDPNERIEFAGYEQNNRLVRDLKRGLMDILATIAEVEIDDAIPLGTRKAIQLDEEAAETYNAWRISTKNGLLARDSANLYDFCQKATGEGILKIAACLAFARQPLGNATMPTIDVETMRAAATISDYAIEMLIYVFNESSSTRQDEKVFLETLEQCEHPMTLREMKRHSRKLQDMSPARVAEIIRMYKGIYIREEKTARMVKYSYMQ